MREQPRDWAPASRVRDFRPSVFSEMTELAQRTGAINLGQGFPDTDGPGALLESAAEAIADGRNQYPPAAGLAELRAAVAEHRTRHGHGPRYRPDDGEVVITTGATEAIAAAVLAFCDPGDELITFNPCYDSYSAVADLAGADLVPVPLTPHDDGFVLDVDALRVAAASPRARVLLLNSPHNPTGKVFTPAELAEVAEVCRDFDLTVVTDEVYEHLTYDGLAHTTIAALPGMDERTLVISSVGKTFSVTGWKVGWACGPRHLTTPLLAAKQYLTFGSGTPFQSAAARVLSSGECDAWIQDLNRSLQRRRDLLREGLEQVGLRTWRAEGGYFVQADVRSWGAPDAVRFCRDLPGRAGVVAVPSSAFHQGNGAPRHLVRFAFCKREEVLREAVARLVAAR
ncbi:aminotransferase class I/II-fold pyridoxal phosphate-dependent enzyme [Streptomyces somaliensis]|uniref:aminotransferase class I/II-fold pyridoxal phosphate-dependent enzyme n=1 Tax=Streptomyces somaliensis TaxID=78355 RepID=UPI0020CD262C|nr:aminotransferase class I/II-fold pyridoxal phosphate-dependent enzyme [Streptomyces somaliensis]MCP9943851.1 aminotransferase class I/II-fold pyridoxal phosphate-dependent enzyme [Streptomyces somaliensis]MCP9962902.1 aminotransferase class I/II-fold pyridoxal phosphate-dependent enzyme [Streptomyces somaliensis]MCP9975749.1 aminotransferase class I/II-fold pyridoxal phosphate-dependent enzyme [Streptomyces somaliensis]